MPTTTAAGTTSTSTTVAAAAAGASSSSNSNALQSSNSNSNGHKYQQQPQRPQQQQQHRPNVSKQPKPVVYIQDDDLCEYDFSLLINQHAMKPYRFMATHELVEALGLHDYMRVIRKVPVMRPENLLTFHDPAYVSNIVQHSERAWEWSPDTSLVGFTGDCPPMEGLMEYSCGVVAASLAGAVLLNAQETDIAINWQGGMHHAKCGECSGFCYFNDIVIAILELLKAPQHERVLYIDLDVHHGDGVEEAFITTDRVFTLSLHKFGDNFFPGTGHPLDLGFRKGKNCTLNVPVWDNINDLHYTTLFERALNGIIQNFQPDAILLQCGADSLAGDRVGTLNVSSVGHSQCVAMVAALGLPLLVVGGGGYSVKNVARLWAAETAVLCGAPIPPNTPLPFDNLPLTGWLYEGSNGTLLVPSNNCGYATGPSNAAGSCLSNSSYTAQSAANAVVVATTTAAGSDAAAASSAAMAAAAAAHSNTILASVANGSISVAQASLSEVNTHMSPFNLTNQHAHLVAAMALDEENAAAASDKNKATVGGSGASPGKTVGPFTEEVTSPAGGAVLSPLAFSNTSSAQGVITVASSLTSFYAFLTSQPAHLLTFNDQLQVLLKFIDERVALIPRPSSTTTAGSTTAASPQKSTNASASTTTTASIIASRSTEPALSKGARAE